MSDTTDSLQKTADLIFALREGLKIYKDRMFFAPPELSQAIGSLSEAERYLKTAIAKMK